MAEDWARPVVHWEIEAQDAELLRGFYGALFNWKIGDGFIMDIAPGIGGPEPGPGGHIRQSDRSGVTLYVQVGDLRTSLDRSVSLGPPWWPSPSTCRADRRWRASPIPRAIP
jgi:predicted enzyme related to lactoylglutathione lyase